MNNRNVSIIIPNWNGRYLLEKNLPCLLKALRGHKGRYEVVVVDDCSSDDSLDFVRSEYPEIKTIGLGEKKGFAEACNKGVNESTNEIIYLLNNDIAVQEDFLYPLLSHFTDKNVFAVSSIEVSPDSSKSSSTLIPLLKFKYGIFWHYYKSTEGLLNHSVPVFFASGGHSAFDREKFLRLGGFDNIYHPFYWEDMDISYRAWKMGWTSLYEPGSRVVHYHQSTIGRHFSKSFIERIHWRNRFLFSWKNLDSLNLWCRHLFFLPFYLISMPFIGKGYYTISFFMAIKKLRNAFEKRQNDRCSMSIGDVQLLKTFREVERDLEKG